MSNNNTKGSAAAPTPSRRTVYIRTVVDVAAVLAQGAVPAAFVGFDPEHLIVTASAGETDRATGEVVLNAQVGDQVRFYAKSGSNNFENSVLIDELRAAAKGKVFSGLKLLKLPRTGIVPAANTGGLPAKFVQQTSWFWQCFVSGEGTQDFSLALALHDRDDAGQPRFVGLYRWGVKLTVRASPPKPTEQQEKTP